MNTTLIILILFSLLGLGLIILTVILKINGAGLLGKTSLNPYLFYTGKPALFISWFFMILKAHKPLLWSEPTSSPIQWITVIILAIATVIILISFLNLGLSTRMGIPTDNTKLKTSGLYSFSRNPMYVGFYLICLASCLYFPNILNILFALFGIITHHLIVLKEEQFLATQFKEQWTIYCNKVRRYI